MGKTKHSDTAVLGEAKWLRAGIEALLYSSVFISLCAFGLTVETYLLTGLPVSMPMAGFVFLATLFTYNTGSVQRVWRGWRAGDSAQSWPLRHQRGLAVLAAMSLAGAAVLFFVFELRISLWLVLSLALISVGYTVPLGSNRAKPLRSIPLLKVFLIALVWSAATVLFPLIDAHSVLDGQVLMLWLRRFLFILALALLFDIRDYTYDRRTRTLTFPGLLGAGTTRLLSLGLLALYLLLVLNTEQGAVLVSLLGGAFVAALIVWNASEDKPRIYYALLADGAMLVHFAFVYLAVS
jgi:4-hydroxybenzoate polyprenyltransferase